jgi:hypothetical protein
VQAGYGEEILASIDIEVEAMARTKYPSSITMLMDTNNKVLSAMNAVYGCNYLLV